MGKVIKFHPLLPIPAMERGPKYAYRLRHDVIVSVVLLRKVERGRQIIRAWYRRCSSTTMVCYKKVTEVLAPLAITGGIR